MYIFEVSYYKVELTNCEDIFSTPYYYATILKILLDDNVFALSIHFGFYCKNVLGHCGCYVSVYKVYSYTNARM